MTTSLEQLNNFSIWFIPFGNNFNTKNNKYENKISKSSKDGIIQFLDKAEADETLVKLFNLGEVNGNSTKPVIKDLASKLNKETKDLEETLSNPKSANTYLGFFAIVFGDNRTVNFYESLDCTSYVRSDSSTQGEKDTKNKEQLKQNIIGKLNKIGELNK